MKPTRNKRAFTLAEIVVAVSVMALMFTSLFSFVMYAGDTWKRNHAAIMLASEADMVFDTVERELMLAKAIITPAAGDSGPAIVYKKTVSDWQPIIHYGDAQLSIAYSYPDVKAVIDAPPPGWTTGVTPADYCMIEGKYQYAIARHVADFVVTRETAQLLHLYIKIQNDPQEDQFRKTIEATRTIFLSTF